MGWHGISMAQQAWGRSSLPWLHLGAVPAFHKVVLNPQTLKREATFCVVMYNVLLVFTDSAVVPLALCTRPALRAACTPFPDVSVGRDQCYHPRGWCQYWSCNWRAPRCCRYDQQAVLFSRPEAAEGHSASTPSLRCACAVDLCATAAIRPERWLLSAQQDGVKAAPAEAQL